MFLTDGQYHYITRKLVKIRGSKYDIMGGKGGRKDSKKRNRSEERSRSRDSVRDKTVEITNKKRRKQEENLSQNSSSQSSNQGSEFHFRAEENGEFDSVNEDEPGMENDLEDDRESRNDEVQAITDTIVEPPSSLEKEVSFKASNDEGRQNQMMKDIGEFFNDADKLTRVWNLVKAINTSDRIKENATNQQECDPPEVQKKNQAGNRLGIDINRLNRISNSETTLYTDKGVEEKSSSPQGRDVSSDGDMMEQSPGVNTSDETISPIEISDPRTRLPPPELIPPPPPRREEEPQPGGSGWTGGSERVRRTKQAATEMLNKARNDKISAAKPPGKTYSRFDDGEETVMTEDLVIKASNLSMLADSLNALSSEGEFDPLTVQLDGQTLEKIRKGAYVDLRRLLPRETIGDDADEDELHWVMQDGTPKLRKKSGHELLSVNGYRRWMIAFSNYSRVYTKENPGRAPEIHQYILDIQDAANTYTWDSVYAYDKIFRMHKV